MGTAIEFIFKNLSKNEADIRAMKKAMLSNYKSLNISFLYLELSVITLALSTYYNSRKIARLEEELKELKGE